MPTVLTCARAVAHSKTENIAATASAAQILAVSGIALSKSRGIDNGIAANPPNSAYSELIPAYLRIIQPVLTYYEFIT